MHVIWDLRKKSSNRLNLTAKNNFITLLLVERSTVKQLKNYTSESEGFIPLMYVVLCLMIPLTSEELTWITLKPLK